MEFPGSHQLLLAAVQDAPRRYRMPPLPSDAQAAALAGPETASKPQVAPEALLR